MSQHVLRGRRVAVLSAVVAALTATAALAFGASPAAADGPGQPFTCTVPTDFYSTGAGAGPVQLLTSSEPSPGFAHPLGGPALPSYNALGFDPNDRFLYAIATGNAHLLRIDSAGIVTDLGPTNLPDPTTDLYAAGAFDPQGRLWVLSEQAQNVAFSINPAQPLNATPQPLSAVMPAIDWTYADGFMWGLAGQTLYQTDLATGHVTPYPVAVPYDSYNAAWTYANGDLGFEGTSSNVTIHLTGAPAGPFVATVSPGPSSLSADGTSCTPVLTVGSGLPHGTYGSGYSQALSITGGTAPYGVSQTGGTLPPGLTLAADGTLSGTATVAGTFTFDVAVTDANHASGSGAVTVTIDPAPLAITASSPTVTYGDASPAITPSYSGLVNGDSAPAMAPACSAGGSALPAAGTYPTSCSGASDPNYAITYTAGVLTVNPAPLVITASSPTIAYGAAIPAITPSYGGFVNGDGDSSLTAEPACTTTATSSSPPGQYPTSCSGASSPNYSISYVGGTLTIQALSCPQVRNGGGQNLHGLNLDGCNLAGYNLSGDNFNGTSLRNAVLTNANLQNANLNNADLTGANLKSAKLTGANLNNANLTDANLTGAVLTGANLHGVTWSNTTCVDGTNSTGDNGTCAGHL